MSTNETKITVDYSFAGLVKWVIAIITGMVGYNIHNSVGWAIVDFFFWPFVWIKWLIYHEVNMSIIKDTFSFFFQ